MPRITLLLLALVTTAVASPFTAQAATSVCRTVNDRTVCSQSGDALSCQTVNGQTRCLSGSGTMRCETVNGRTACTTTPGNQGGDRAGGRAEDRVGEQEDSENGDSLPDPDIPSSGTPLPVLPDAGVGGRGLSIERDGHGLRVRTGTLDLRLRHFP